MEYSVGMENLYVSFMETNCSQQMLLGRRVRDFVTREFEGRDGVGMGDVKNDEICAVLTLDMPLISYDDVMRYVGLMRMRRIKRIELGRQGEAYISIGNAPSEGIFAEDDAFLKISDAKSYNMVYNLLRQKILRAHLRRGVNIIDISTCFVDDTVSLESGSTIMPFCRLEGNTSVARGATVSASTIIDGFVGEGATVEMSYIVSSTIGSHATVGPFARLREATVGEGCRVGDFVEIKASELGRGVKAAHLAYIGDATVGEGTNVGCGTVFCNYDGHFKHRTEVGRGCFIGANSNLIAPLKVGADAFIAAGTTVTKDVADGSFTIGRVRQDTKIKGGERLKE